MKKFLSMIMAIVMVFSLSATAFATDFKDVKDQDRNYDAIEVLTTLGVVNGYDEDHFCPNDKLTRSQLCAMLVRAMYDEKTFVLTDNSFKDVPFYHWAKIYIDTAAMHGLMNGYSEEFFGPDDKLTYTQTARVILNALGYGELEWPMGVNTVAYSLNLYNDIVGISFEDTCTRAHAAQMIYNAFNANLVSLYAGQYFVTKDNFLNDILGFKETTFISEEGSNAGHEYLAYENIADKHDKKDYITDIRLSYEKTIYSRNNGNSYAFYENKGKEYDIIWKDGIQVYKDGKAVSNRADTVKAINEITGIFNEDGDLIAISCETPGVIYLPGNHKDLPSYIKRDDNYNEYRSTVTYWENKDKGEDYIISNDWVKGVITDISWDAKHREYEIELNGNNDYTIDYDNALFIGHEMNAEDFEHEYKGEDIILYYDYLKNLVGYELINYTPSKK